MKEGEYFQPTHQSEATGQPNVYSLEDVKDPEVREEYIKQQLRNLLSESEPVVIEAKAFNMHDGFLHPDSIIHVVQDERIPGFKVNDIHIFTELLNKLQETQSIPTAVQLVIDEYFKVNHATKDPTRGQRARQLFTDRKSDEHLTIKEIADQDTAVCAQKAALAQNLITFLGTHSWMVDSYAELTKPDGSISKGQHLYNILDVAPGHKVLYDPHHPFEIYNEAGALIGTKPARFNITQEQFEGLKEKQIIVQHITEIQQGADMTYAYREYRYGGEGSVRK